MEQFYKEFERKVKPMTETRQMIRNTMFKTVMQYLEILQIESIQDYKPAINEVEKLIRLES